MKQTILVIVCVLLAGYVILSKKPQIGWHTIVIDSCEYLEPDGIGDYVIIHKGNCSNPIHLTGRHAIIEKI